MIARPDRGAIGQRFSQLADLAHESGLDIEYLMLRGIFMPAKATPDQVAFYVDLFQKVRETADWKDFMAKGAFNTSFKSGDEYKAWVASAADTHKGLMEKAGFLAKK